jgi:phosphoribosylamine--glycine ligase
VATGDLDALIQLARDEQATFTIVGPETPLAEGIVDRFRAAGLSAFGPTAGAAQIESSKAFAKRLLLDAGVPTAAAAVCSSEAEARAAIDRMDVPVVIKASGLAAGKGVVISESREDAYAAVAAMMGGRSFGSAGEVVVIEEFMRGEELSLFVITDGERAIPLVPAQDHKRLLGGDRGPNTGGMGAYAPVSLATGDRGALIDGVMDKIIQPTLAAMRSAGSPFTGLLYAGLMLTEKGPMVVEFNSRFGDPETQAVMPILQASLSITELMHIVARGDRLPAGVTVSATGCAVTTVLAARGYPDSPATGDRILLPPAPDGVIVFHAGTRRDDDGHLVTSGGRVLSVTGVGATIADAATASRTHAGAIDFEGKQFRGDIAWRELDRWRSSI